MGRAAPCRGKRGGGVQVSGGLGAASLSNCFKNNAGNWLKPSSDDRFACSLLIMRLTMMGARMEGAEPSRACHDLALVMHEWGARLRRVVHFWFRRANDTRCFGPDPVSGAPTTLPWCRRCSSGGASVGSPMSHWPVISWTVERHTTHGRRLKRGLVSSSMSQRASGSEGIPI